MTDWWRRERRPDGTTYGRTTRRNRTRAVVGERVEHCGESGRLSSDLGRNELDGARILRDGPIRLGLLVLWPGTSVNVVSTLRGSIVTGAVIIGIVGCVIGISVAWRVGHRDWALRLLLRIVGPDRLVGQSTSIASEVLLVLVLGCRQFAFIVSNIILSLRSRVLGDKAVVRHEDWAEHWTSRGSRQSTSNRRRHSSDSKDKTGSGKRERDSRTWKNQIGRASCRERVSQLV